MTEKKQIKILAIGDIMGRPGRNCLKTHMPQIRQDYQPDLVVLNGENIAGGFGVTEKIFCELKEAHHFDVMTTGNHWHDQKEIYTFKEKYKELLLPANMYNVDDYRKGYCLVETSSGVPVGVINLTGKLFMKGDNRCPFKQADQILSALSSQTKIIVVDLHAEASSEKQAMGQYLCGRASLVYGTHTHCPTADHRILNQQTGFVTDLGMTGGYQSVIGMGANEALGRFLHPQKVHRRMQPAKEDPRLCAILAHIDIESGHCSKIERVSLPNFSVTV